jgi:hypothetical protein
MFMCVSQSFEESSVDVDTENPNSGHLSKFITYLQDRTVSQNIRSQSQLPPKFGDSSLIHSITIYIYIYMYIQNLEWSSL